MHIIFLTTIALVATVVNAQSLPACLNDCATSVCGGTTDLECLCVANATAIFGCIESNCPTDLAIAESAGATECAGIFSM